MSQAKSKYDYPGLPLWANGLPVGVGDEIRHTAGVRCRVYWINRPVFLRLDHPGFFDADFSEGNGWKLVMPPGFPKDRRWTPTSTAFRFVDDWHGYWLGGSYKGTAERRSHPCSDTDCWEFDGDGNPVKSEPTELERLRERVEAMRLDIEQVRNIAETARADARIASDAIEQISAIQPVSTPAETTPNTETLPTDPADWEPCEWDGKTFPVFMRDRNSGNFVEKFLDAENSVLMAENNVNFLGRKYKWTGFKADSESWTPVRPKRRQPEPDPLSDEALKAWFWENARRVDVWNTPGEVCMDWLDASDFCGTDISAKANTFQAALRSLRKQVMERENGGAE